MRIRKKNNVEQHFETVSAQILTATNNTSGSSENYINFPTCSQLHTKLDKSPARQQIIAVSCSQKYACQLSSRESQNIVHTSKILDRTETGGISP